MKPLRILLSVLALNGCAMVDAYLMKYDANEYQLITQIRVNAVRFSKQCASLNAAGNAEAMAEQTELFEKYSEKLPRNVDGYHAAKLLNEIAQGLAERYTQPAPVSAVFCKIKYNSIENSAVVLQTVIGKKPR
jgi:hypothetical protein